MKHNNILLYIFILASLFGSRIAFSQKQICTDSINSWLNFLASDEMKGRANGSKEIDNIAMWLSKKYKEIGIKSFENLEDFIQPYILDDSPFIHKNVIGYIPGKRNNSNSFIVLSAHFDHLGTHSEYAVNGDSIFNGANDDASGIVAMLAIARNLSEQNIHLDCPIIITTFSNEETHGLGSSYFCNSGIVPIQKMKVNINLEMLGRTDEYGKNKFYISGPKYSNLQDIIVDFNKNTNWEIAETGDVADIVFKIADSFILSECASDAGVCIPAHSFLISGIKSGLHQPNDEVKYIDFDNLNNAITHFTQLIIHLASDNIEIKCKQEEY